MKLAAVQFKGVRDDKPGSLETLRQLTKTAAQNADLVVLPEMAATRYVHASRETIAHLAEPARGQTFAALSPIAKANACWLVAGFPEVASGRYFNSALVINPKGELAFCYRKTLLFQDDYTWATPGDSGYRAFDTSWGRFTVGICMDINDTHFLDYLRTSNADVLAFPTNWIEQFTAVWKYWRDQTGDEIVLVAANTYGLDKHAWFSGRSVIQQGNRTFAHGPWLGDAVISASI